MNLKRLGIISSISICIAGCTIQNECLQKSDLQNFRKIEPLDLKIGNIPTPPSDIAFPISADGLPDVNFIEENEKISSNQDNTYTEEPIFTTTFVRIPGDTTSP